MTESNPNVPPPPPSNPVPPAGNVPPANPVSGSNVYVGPEPTSDAKTMALLAHLLNVLFLVPLLVWLLKKDSHPFVDDQGKEALNFSLSCLIIHIICTVTSFLCIPALISLAVFIVQIVFGIMGAVAANKGQAYRYPVNIRMIK